MSVYEVILFRVIEFIKFNGEYYCSCLNNFPQWKPHWAFCNGSSVSITSSLLLYLHLCLQNTQIFFFRHADSSAPVCALQPDRAFTAHKLLIRTFILGHGVYGTHSYWDSGSPCGFLLLLLFYSGHNIVTAVSCHWGEVLRKIQPIKRKQLWYSSLPGRQRRFSFVW